MNLHSLRERVRLALSKVEVVRAEASNLEYRYAIPVGDS
jgi:hypothetical protein